MVHIVLKEPLIFVVQFIVLACNSQAFESILLSVNQKFERRLKYFQPVVSDIVKDMRDDDRPTTPLLPLRNSLSQFEETNKNIAKVGEHRDIFFLTMKLFAGNVHANMFAAWCTVVRALV